MPNELTSEHAKALSELGAAKGGHARAAALSPEERSDIARRAAESRWASPEKPSMPKETHPGIIKIGNAELQCGVLDNGIRVFSTRGVTRALGGRRTGTAGTAKDGAPQLPSFLASESIKPFISPQLMARLITPLQYKPKHGGRTAFGYEATLLPEICELILDANAKKPFRPNQKHLVDTATLLIRGFARVGIIALVDEATGYQEEREKRELALILEAYIEESLRPYVSKFQSDFFREAFRLHKWEYNPSHTKRPKQLGNFINKYIYEPLPPGVLTRLRELNPVIKNKEGKYGYRKHRHMEFLTENVGEPHLDKQLAAVTALMKVSDDLGDFDDKFRKAFAKHYQQKLNFGRAPLVVDVDAEGSVN